MARGVKDPRVWQRMLSGRRLDLIDPSPVDVEIEDIAHGLARMARWNGQTKGAHAYSVAQHSVLVEAIARSLAPDLSPQAQAMILLHDAPEYVIGDMISPFKAVLGGDYKGVENRLLAAIHLRFGLPPAPTKPVAVIAKQADKIAAWYEATTLAGFARDEADSFFGPPPRLMLDPRPYLQPEPAQKAQAIFLARFQEIDAALAH
ncbi:MAG: HD family hydrolase [Beijerinckiaceae bacterium]|nr:HD family hydrolase [Beijerinckiaceae bacterium]